MPRKTNRCSVLVPAARCGGTTGDAKEQFHESSRVGGVSQFEIVGLLAEVKQALSHGTRTFAPDSGGND